MLVALEPVPEPDYAFPTVLVTPPKRLSAPSSRLFCAPMVAPMGDGPDREAGRPTCDGLRTSPTRAFVSAASLITRSAP